ncbi:uncharacterized protein [Haliotis asinina]|uniref:uncharacterized protein n=1 Tax=Haliotis asinina TaxID=109174 RepID=UPI003531AD00
MSALRAAVLVSCLLVGVALTFALDDSNIDEDLDETSCLATLQQAYDTKNRQGKEGNRQKRQINQYYPFGNLINNAYLGETYSSRYLYKYGRYPYTPIVENRFDNLPIYRLFKSFTPAGTVRKTRLFVRNYARLNTNYADALSDFQVLPLVNVQVIQSSSVTHNVAQPDYIANVYGIPGAQVRLMANGCPLVDHNSVALPCLSLTLNSSLPFGRVLRRIAYIPRLRLNDEDNLLNANFLGK